ncbi:hypothetical protein [Marinomonas colpomeniae]|uniref:Uncharacterized protein n=1 Tax=Marinomonas colpomeniae TaxID=2774408 RepID=A0ABR8P1P2_9GAMM|nr:hypothetical protein [Marinomonas colpomeniae]MBD5772108.1 hypothetical protein [Marinomonas colpomeniae]
MRDQKSIERNLQLYDRVKMAWVTHLIGVISVLVRSIGLSYSEETKTISLHVVFESDPSEDEVELYEDAEAEFISGLDDEYLTYLDIKVMGKEAIEQPSWGFVFKRLE